MSKQCENCKYCDVDYEWDDLSEDEVEIEICGKGHDISSNMDCCKDFKEYKPKPYKEEYTECDSCEYLPSCENVIESTLRQDMQRHFEKGRGYCQKQSVEIGKKKLSEIIKIADKLSFLDGNSAISLLRKAVDRFGDITYDELMKDKIYEFME